MDAHLGLFSTTAKMWGREDPPAMVKALHASGKRPFKAGACRTWSPTKQMVGSLDQMVTNEIAEYFIGGNATGKDG